MGKKLMEYWKAKGTAYRAKIMPMMARMPAVMRVRERGEGRWSVNVSLSMVAQLLSKVPICE